VRKDTRPFTFFVQLGTRLAISLCAALTFIFVYKIVWLHFPSPRNVVQFVGSIVFMIQLTWKLTMITLVGIPLITVVTKYYGGLFKVQCKPY